MLGVSNDPGNSNGAVIAKTVNLNDFTSEIVLNEQGVHDVEYKNNKVYVVGADPVEPTNEWSLGNLYVKDSVWIKRRTIPNAIHTLGFESTADGIFVATGSHTGDNATWQGRVYKSVDDGVNWTYSTVSNYRLYDLIYFGGYYYATAYEWSFSTGYYSGVYRSPDGASNWTPVYSILAPLIKPRLIVFNDKLLIFSSTLLLYAIDLSGNVISYNLPVICKNNWNPVTVTTQYLYYIGVNNLIYRTPDFNIWTKYSTLNNATTIYYSALFNKIIVADMGTSFSLWELPEI